MNAASKHPAQRPHSEAEAMSHVVDRLRQQFPELSADVIESAVHGRYGTFDGHPVRDFVPILVERAARQELITHHRA
ncbi:MAG TPA: hypothetical protein VGL39_04915 [Jatrophihabitantaceae bacterium]|jgi:hypothetical protein